MSNYDPIIKTTQTSSSDFVSIVPVEVRGAEFPMNKDEIAKTLRDDDVNCVRTSLDYRCQAWCVFKVEAGDIVIDRLTVRDQNQLADVLDNLFDTLTFSPLRQPCRVVLIWPEHGTDHFVFRHLIDTGWKTCGIERDLFFKYGSNWDGIKLERIFER